MSIDTDYVFILFDHNSQIRGIFKKRANAISSVPEKKRNFQTEIARRVYAFGDQPRFRWTLREFKVEDSGDLAL